MWFSLICLCLLCFVLFFRTLVVVLVRDYVIFKVYSVWGGMACVYIGDKLHSD